MSAFPSSNSPSQTDSIFCAGQISLAARKTFANSKLCSVLDGNVEYVNGQVRWENGKSSDGSICESRKELIMPSIGTYTGLLGELDDKTLTYKGEDKDPKGIKYDAASLGGILESEMKEYQWTDNGILNQEITDGKGNTLALYHTAIPASNNEGV